MESVRGEAKPEWQFLRAPLDWSIAGCWSSNPSEPHPGLGRTDQPYFIFSSGETWVVAGTIRYPCRQIKPARERGIISPLGDFSPPTPAGTGRWYKRQATCPLGCPLSGRGEVGSSTPATSLPARGPASGWGTRSPPRRSSPRQTPQLRSKGGIGTSPVDRRQERLWVQRDALRALSPAGLAGGSLPGERAPLSVPPQTSARRRGRRGSRGGLTRRSWLISS